MKIHKKLSLCSEKQGFGIRDPEKTYSGSRIQGSKGTGTMIRNPGINYQTARLEPLLASSLLRQVQVLTPLNKLQFRIHFEKLTLIT
jgi:hypothetical protein